MPCNLPSAALVTMLATTIPQGSPSDSTNGSPERTSSAVIEVAPKLKQKFKVKMRRKDGADRKLPLLREVEMEAASSTEAKALAESDHPDYDAVSALAVAP